LEEAVVRGDEGDIDTLRVAFQVPPPSRASLQRRALSAHPLPRPRRLGPRRVALLPCAAA
jgi:hypothetical protein